MSADGPCLAARKASLVKFVVSVILAHPIALLVFITVMMAATTDRNTFLIGASNFLTQFLPAGPFLPAGGGQECHMAP